MKPSGASGGRYIGGSGSIVDKSHAFFSGEKVAKSAVMINDSKDTVRLTGHVSVMLDGKVVYSTIITQSVASGTKRSLAVSFTAPEVDEKKSGAILLELKANKLALASDRFEWECFPRPGKMEPKGGITLVDNVGGTSEMLREAAVATSSELTADTRLVIIGREALKSEAKAKLRKWRIMDRVAKGLNVLVFEQRGRELAGMPMDDPNCRGAFNRAPAHPVMSGLDDKDLRNWRGQSDITEPYPNYSQDDLPWGEEFVRWGNRGVVCSFAPEKPQRGNFRVLADADFDLYLAPLQEWHIGRGRLIFCQLDVTARYGKDPVPTLLIKRLIEYMTEAPAGPALTGAVLKGGKATGALAKTLSVRADGNSKLVFVGPDWRGKADELLAAAGLGGRVVIAGNVRKELLERVFGCKSRTQGVFKVSVPPELAERGIAPGGFFWRTVKKVAVLGATPSYVIHTEPALVAMRKFGKGEIFWCSVTPADFSDTRQVGKTMRLLSALLRAGDAGPDLNAERLLEPGRAGSPYAVPGLGFNPYKYRRW